VEKVSSKWFFQKMTVGIWGKGSLEAYTNIKGEMKSITKTSTRNLGNRLGKKWL